MTPNAPNAYEAERLSHIADNRQQMAALGLLDAGRDLAQLGGEGAARSPARAQPRRRSLGAPVEIRRSDRCDLRPCVALLLLRPARHRCPALCPRSRRRPSPRPALLSDRGSGKPAPRNFEAGALYEPVERRAKAAGRARALLLGFDSRGGWHPGKGQAGGAACEAAAEAAEELALALPRPAFPKRLTDSQVAGGFWANAPRGLARPRAGGGGLRVDITMRVAAGTTMADGSDAEAVEELPVVWLPHGKKSAGFSGGCRGFAIAQDLYPGDCVIFEVEAPRALVVHVLRAFDYESAAVRAARPSAAAAAAAAAGEGGSEDEEGEDEEKEGAPARLARVRQHLGAGGQPRRGHFFLPSGAQGRRLAAARRVRELRRSGGGVVVEEAESPGGVELCIWYGDDVELCSSTRPSQDHARGPGVHAVTEVLDKAPRCRKVRQRPCLSRFAGAENAR
jgi:hypothetical protein